MKDVQLVFDNLIEIVGLNNIRPLVKGLRIKSGNNNEIKDINNHGVGFTSTTNDSFNVIFVGRTSKTISVHFLNDIMTLFQRHYVDIYLAEVNRVIDAFLASTDEPYKTIFIQGVYMRIKYLDGFNINNIVFGNTTFNRYFIDNKLPLFLSENILILKYLFRKDSLLFTRAFNWAIVDTQDLSEDELIERIAGIRGQVHYHRQFTERHKA